MRIKYCYQRLWPAQSPGTIFVTYSTLGFYQNDIDFELITVANTKKPVRTVLKNKFGIQEDLPIHLLRLGPLRRTHWMVCLMQFFYLLSRDFDVLITRDLGFLPYALLLRRIKQCRVAFESHDFFTDLRLFTPRFAGRRKKQSRQERRYCPKVDMIICQTTHQKTLYERYYPLQNVVVAVSGIRPYKSASPKTPFQYRLGYFGTISSRNYDIELLIHAFSKTVTPDITLLLAGAKTLEEKTYVNRLAQQYHVRERVKVLLWMDPKEMDRLKEKIDIGCCPLVFNERNKVATPLKALEYLSAGIPVLHSDLQTTDFIIKHNYNGFLVSPRAEEWARAIDGIYSDFIRYQELSHNCLETARRGSWEQRAKRLHKFFNDSFIFPEK